VEFLSLNRVFFPLHVLSKKAGEDRDGLWSGLISLKKISLIATNKGKELNNINNRLQKPD